MIQFIQKHLLTFMFTYHLWQTYIMVPWLNQPPGFPNLLGKFILLE